VHRCAKPDIFLQIYNNNPAAQFTKLAYLNSAFHKKNNFINLLAPEFYI